MHFKKLATVAALLMLACLPAMAQYTTLTGTVNDPTGSPYANGFVSASYVNGAGCGLPLLQGSVFQTTVGFVLTTAGAIPSGVVVADNNQVCVGSQWRFNVQNAARTTGFTTLITVTGASQAVGTTLTAASVILTGTGIQTDAFIMVPPGNCIMTPTTTAFTAGPTLTRAAAGNVVLSGTTNTTAGTITLTCDLTELLTRTTAGKGVTITSVDVYYGIQTTAMSSIAALTPSSITLPAAGGAAAGTVATIGGSLTVTPGSLQLTTTTAGQCFHENVAFGTAFAWNPDGTRVSLEQVFTTAGTTATVLQLCGAEIHFTNNVL